jgi:hypothetical protein
MSHFAVMVIGDDVDGQLAPFHEFECTGVDDEYVQNIDKLVEASEEYEKRDEKISGRSYATFAEFVEKWYGLAPIESGREPDLAGKHKYGWSRATPSGDVTEAIRRTNPNAKWDWYQIGGRMTGTFKLKAFAHGELGSPGVFGREAPEGTADQARKGDIDLEAMRDEAGERAGDRYDRVHAVIAGREFNSWPVIREMYLSRGDESERGALIEAARHEYSAQPVIRDIRASKDDVVLWASFDGIENYMVPRDEYVERARRAAGVTFAVVKDGTWYEKGKMGWWAMVSDEKADGAWEREFAALLDSVPDDTTLTVVDCHI